MINPQTNTNAGAGVTLSLGAVNGNDRQNIRTDSNGLATADIQRENYTLTSVCAVCHPNNQTQFGTNYFINVGSDGSVQVLSATGESISQDASGAWRISTELVRKAVSDDPWQLMVTKPNLANQTAKVAWLLPNGKVLVQTTGNGQLENWWTITPDADGNYYDGTWNQVARIPDYNPWAYNGAILHSGNFFVTGGEVNFSDAGGLEQNTSKSFIYNVSNNTWIPVAPPNNGQGIWAHISAPPFAVLTNGQVMIGNFSDRNPTDSHESMLFDENTMKWTITGQNKTGMNSEAGFTLLPNGKVLTVNTDGAGNTAEIYDPASGSWSKTGIIPDAISAGEVGPAIALPNGKVLAQGATGANALYDPSTNSWSSAASFPKLANGLQLSAPDNPTAILPNGNVLTVTGYLAKDTQNISIMGPARYFEYDWKSNTWLQVMDDLLLPPASSNPQYMKMIPLPNGQIMVLNHNANPGSGGIAFYTSKGSADPSWAPIIEKLSDTTLSPSKTFNVSGKQLSGLTEGAQFGDEFENATNFPLVRIVNNLSHHVFYASTRDFSNTSIAPMAESNFNFSIGSEVENGASQLYVVSNGIASAPSNVTITGGVTVVAAKASSTTQPTPRPTAQGVTPQGANRRANPALTTITCAKGSASKKVTALKPTCPKGYRKK